MSDEIMTQFKAEGDPAFPAESTEKENSGESSPETKETNVEQTQSQEGDQNSGENKDANGDGTKKTDANQLDEHPRWKEREDNWKTRFNDQELRHTNEITKLNQALLELKTSLTKGPNTQSTESLPQDVPSWFGGEESQWKEFVKFNESLLSKAKADAKTELFQEITSRGEADKKAIQEATDYMNQEIAKIEVDKKLNPEGEKIDDNVKNKLYVIAEKFNLITPDQKWNWPVAFMFYKNQKGKVVDSTNEKKEASGSTISDKKTETRPSPVKTSEDFKGKNWGSL